MKRPLIALLFLLVFAGCATNSIEAVSVRDAVELVTARLDAYVQADQGLTDTERDEALLLSSRARSAFQDNGSVPYETASGVLSQVLVMHDAYVTSDPALDEDEKTNYTLTTELLRRVLAEAAK